MKGATNPTCNMSLEFRSILYQIKSQKNSEIREDEPYRQKLIQILREEGKPKLSIRRNSKSKTFLHK